MRTRRRGSLAANPFIVRRPASLEVTVRRVLDGRRAPVRVSARQSAPVSMGKVELAEVVKLRGRSAGADSEKGAARLASQPVTTSHRDRQIVCNKKLVLNWLHASGIVLLDLSAQLSVPVPELRCVHGTYLVSVDMHTLTFLVLDSVCLLVCDVREGSSQSIFRRPVARRVPPRCKMHTLIPLVPDAVCLLRDL